MGRTFWWGIKQGCFKWDPTGISKAQCYLTVTPVIWRQTLLIILADRQTGGKLKNDHFSYSKKPPCFSEESHSWLWSCFLKTTKIKCILIQTNVELDTNDQGMQSIPNIRENPVNSRKKLALPLNKIVRMECCVEVWDAHSKKKSWKTRMCMTKVIEIKRDVWKQRKTHVWKLKPDNFKLWKSLQQ